MNNEKVYGYARISTREQNISRQVEALKEYGVASRDIITDCRSGKDFDRVGYQTLKNNLLRAGDTLVIKEIDRLGRDMNGIKREWNELEEMGVNIVIIDTHILNTKGKSDLEKRLISTIVFELLTYLAEKERLKIKQRQKEGIQALKDRNNGKGIGRPKVLVPNNFEEVYLRTMNHEITASEAMRILNLKRNTYYKIVKQRRLERFKRLCNSVKSK